MVVRVVRFTDVDAQRMQELTARINESDGPPEGVTAKSVQVLVDSDQGTAVVIQTFETADDMRSSEAALEGMDSSATPGTRVSIDRCEVAVEMSA